MRETDRLVRDPFDITRRVAPGARRSVGGLDDVAPEAGVPTPGRRAALAGAVQAWRSTRPDR